MTYTVGLNTFWPSGYMAEKSAEHCGCAGKSARGTFDFLFSWAFAMGRSTARPLAGMWEASGVSGRSGEQLLNVEPDGPISAKYPCLFALRPSREVDGSNC